jgi:outer membrane protein OmpA-like peptidoglycan-associated protein
MPEDRGSRGEGRGRAPRRARSAVKQAADAKTAAETAAARLAESARAEAARLADAARAAEAAAKADADRRNALERQLAEAMQGKGAAEAAAARLAETARAEQQRLAARIARTREVAPRPALADRPDAARPARLPRRRSGRLAARLGARERPVERDLCRRAMASIVLGGKANFASGSARVPAAFNAQLKQGRLADGPLPRGGGGDFRPHRLGRPARRQSRSVEGARRGRDGPARPPRRPEGAHLRRGYGPDRPAASNDTFEGRAQNRRIEFQVK